MRQTFHDTGDATGARALRAHGEDARVRAVQLRIEHAEASSRAHASHAHVPRHLPVPLLVLRLPQFDQRELSEALQGEASRHARQVGEGV